MSEESRASEYRRMRKARARNKRAIERGLKGNADRKAALVTKTDPLLSKNKDGVERGDLHR